MRDCFNTESAPADYVTADRVRAGYTSAGQAPAGCASAGCASAGYATPDQTSTTFRTAGWCGHGTGDRRTGSDPGDCTSAFTHMRGDLLRRFRRVIQRDSIPACFFGNHEFSPDGRVSRGRVYCYFCRHPLWKNSKEIVSLRLFSLSPAVFLHGRILPGEFFFSKKFPAGKSLVNPAVRVRPGSPRIPTPRTPPIPKQPFFPDPVPRQHSGGLLPSNCVY